MLKKMVSLIAAVAVLTSCGNHSADEQVSRSVFAMDTYMTVTAFGENAADAVTESIEEIARLDKLWNINDPDSDFSRINCGGEVTVSHDTAELISFALDMNEKTGGALDITLLPVLREWGFTTGEYHVPNDETISALLEYTGSDKVKVSGDTVSVEKGIMITPGAVAKGITGDIISEIMRENGVSSAIIDLGGNIQTVGQKPDGSEWKIGLKDPRGQGIFGTVEISDMAVVTSGGYERFFEQDGETYWHILDPKTGRPARSGVISATVIGGEGSLCDALSTAFFVMGEQQTEDFWRRSGGFDFVLVTDDDRVIISEGLKDRYTSNGLYGEPEVISFE
ncbi:MAG: FAD:protein FMN transferase [Ruminococcus sp.]|nr:FAD:protein FMN transferase [Ruminococcus sp.]